MILVYYRREDGTIRYFHQYPADDGIEEAKKAANKYNNEKAGKDTAHIVEYDDNSFEAYLYRKTIEKKHFDEETMRDLISSLEEALDSARYLGG